MPSPSSIQPGPRSRGCRWPTLGVRAAAEAAGARVDGGDPATAARPACWRAPGRRCRGSARRAARGRSRPLERGEQRGHVAGGAHPDGVAEAELACSPGRAAARRRRPPGRPAPALPRVAEAHRDVRPHSHAAARAPAHDRLEHRELTRRASRFEVALGEGLGGAGEDRDRRRRPRRAPGPARARWAPAPGRRTPARRSSRASSSSASASCGHPLRVDEAGGLDDGQARGGQPVDELRLDRGRNDRLLVLQPVPRAHFPDRDPLGKPPGSGDRLRKAKFADAHRNPKVSQR